MSKRILQHPEEAATGAKYWRSLEQLAETPESKLWKEREFQAGASELNPEVGRRSFVKYMAASAALAGLSLSACRREQKNLVPFSQGVEWSVPGKPIFYATSRPHRRGAQALVVATHDGRPTKVEGNPAHPVSKGAANTHSQTSLLDLYDPDRSRIFQLDGVKHDEAEFMKWVKEEVLAKAGDGASIAFLSEHSTSPTFGRLQKQLMEKLPKAIWASYEPLNGDEARLAHDASFGEGMRPTPQIEKADVILALDSDFLGSDEGSTAITRAFSTRRKPEQKMNRLYVVENRYSTTGGMADHRLRSKVSQVGVVALAFAEQIAAATGDAGLQQIVGKVAKPAGAGTWLQAAAKIAGKAESWIKEAAKDLAAQKGKALVLVGYRQPAAVQAVGHAINAALGSFGQTVLGRTSGRVSTVGITELAVALGYETPAQKESRMAATKAENEARVARKEAPIPIAETVRLPHTVKTLFIIGGNPVYNAPVDLRFAELLEGVTVVRHGYYEDESTYSIGADDQRTWVKWHVPAAHYLEAWGDGMGSDGSLVSQQPMILPLFGGWSEVQLLNLLLTGTKAEGMELVQESFKGIAGGITTESWAKFLHDGFYVRPPAPDSAPSAVLEFKALTVGTLLATYVPPAGEMEVVFAHCTKVDDGRFSNNAWLQELPDPITKLTWDNAALLSPATARKLQLEAKQGNGIFHFDNGTWLTVDVGGRSLTIPALIIPGHADDSITIALGYGHTHEGRVGGRHGNYMSKGGWAAKLEPVGFNAYLLRTTGTMYFATGAKVSKLETGEAPYKLAITQEHGALEGRGVDIIREGNAADFKEDPGFAKSHEWLHERNAMDAHAEAVDKNGFPVARSFYEHPADSTDAKKRKLNNDPNHQWAMAVDLSVCTGCSACMVACQAENNIAVVGKEQVLEGRELHWIRMDRYFATPMNSRANKVVDIDDPRMVVQPMPCQHCENAPCETVCPVNATVHSDDGLNIMAYNRCIGTRYCANNCPFKVRRFNFFDFNERQKDKYHKPNILEKRSMPETLQMSKNPNVTVRMRGVMEKCTFCVQRVEEAKIAAKVKAKDTDKVQVPTDSFQVACQQVCASGAITFGNMLDEKSMVARDIANPRTYRLLDYIGVKPRVHYLARIMNPNPAMPDVPLDELEMNKQLTPAGGVEKKGEKA
jgi:MoCo/4Fe-4S cofactor protein with predicted Tat translocation signal